jgi:hypothetical protein
MTGVNYKKIVYLIICWCITNYFSESDNPDLTGYSGLATVAILFDIVPLKIDNNMRSLCILLVNGNHR